MSAVDPLILSRQGPPLIHAHANGYPPQAYRHYLEPFRKDYRVQAIFLRPFWPGMDPEILCDWRIFRDDYLRDLPSLAVGREGVEVPVIGMGHSLGAVTTLMAAIESPDSFRALVLIEPTLFQPWRGAVMRVLAPYRVFRHVHPLVRRTMRRKVSFPDRESMFANYRTKGIFTRISDEVLWDYVEGLADDRPDASVGLKYHPLWETRIYETGGSVDPYIMGNLSRVTCPVLVLRGEESDTIGPEIVDRLVAGLPAGEGIHVPDLGHLLPLEAPEETAQLALEFLARTLG
ncbi:MAG: alpha/beta fold hydrolase [Anaerolineales bacterium]